MSTAGTIGAAFIEVRSDDSVFEEDLVTDLTAAAEEAQAAIEEHLGEAAATISEEFKGAADAAQEALFGIDAEGAFTRIVEDAKLAAEGVQEALFDIDAGRAFQEIADEATVAGEEMAGALGDAADEGGSTIVRLLSAASVRAREALSAIGDTHVFGELEARAEAAGAVIGNSMRSAATSAQGALGTVGAGASTLLGPLKLVALAATGGLAAVTAMGIKSSASLEQTTTAFTSLLGSASKAQTLLVQLQQFSASTPFDFQSVAHYAQQFLSMHDSVGLAQQQLLPFLTTIGDLASATGASTDNISNAILAISQMGSVGKVQAGNLIQVAQAFPGFNAVAAIANQLGETSAQVMKDMAAGTLDAATAVPALVRGMQQFRGAAGAMVAQSETLNGILSTFGDTARISLTNAFKPVIPVVKDTVNQLTPILGTALNKLGPQIADAVTKIAPALGPLVTTLGSVLGTVAPLLADAFAAVGPLLPPIALGLQGIGAAVGPVLTLFATLISAVLDPIAPLVTEVADVIGALATNLTKALLPILPDVRGAITAVADAFRVLMPSMKDAGITLAGVLVSALHAVVPLLPVLGRALLEIGGAIAGAVLPVLPVLVGAFVNLITALTPLVPILAGGLATAIRALGPALVPLARGLGTIAAAVSGALVPILPLLVRAFDQIITALAPLIPAIATGLTNALLGLAPLLPSLATAFVDIVEALLPLVPLIVDLLNFVARHGQVIAQFALAFYAISAGVRIAQAAMLGYRIVMLNLAVAQALLNKSAEDGALAQVTAAARTVGAWVAAGAAAVSSAAATVAAWVVSKAQAVAGAAVTIASLARQAAAFLAQRAVMLASAAATGVVTAAQWLLNAALDANPIGLIILLIAGLVVGLIELYRHSETFREIVTGAFHAVTAAAQAVFGFISRNWPLLLAILTGPFGTAVLLIVRNWDTIKKAGKAAFDALGTAAHAVWDDVLRPIFKTIADTFMDVVGTLVHGAATAFGWVPGIGGKLKAAARTFDNFKDEVNAALSRVQKDVTVHAHIAGFADVSGKLNQIAQQVGYLQVNGDATIHLGVHTGRAIAARASGGPVVANTPYLVGETGKELFVPDVNGQIIDAVGTKNLENRSKGSGVPVDDHADLARGLMAMAAALSEYAEKPTILEADRVALARETGNGQRAVAMRR